MTYVTRVNICPTWPTSVLQAAGGRSELLHGQLRHGHRGQQVAHQPAAERVAHAGHSTKQHGELLCVLLKSLNKMSLVTICVQKLLRKETGFILWWRA